MVSPPFPGQVVSASRTRAVVESFRRALNTGDPQHLLDVLAPQVVLLSDGGGVKRAALHPVVGARKIVRFYSGGTAKVEGRLTSDPTVVNGNPAFFMRLNGEIEGDMALRVEDARIAGLYFVRSPEKLTHLGSETPLTLR